MHRKVGKDRTVSLLGKLYEAPEGLIGNTVTLVYHERDPQVSNVNYFSLPTTIISPDLTSCLPAWGEGGRQEKISAF